METEPSLDAARGLRLRQVRLSRNMSQAALARQAGISASYLNLIEHGRRPVAGALLNTLARLLEVTPGFLGQGLTPLQLAQLKAIAAGLPDPDLAPAEAFAAHFPGWAEVTARQARDNAALRDRIAAQADRMTHDAELAAALHEVISAVTSIRSTASILDESPDLDAVWRARFQGNILAESVRLTDQAQALARRVTRPEARGQETPAEALLAAHDYHLEALEHGQPPETLLEALSPAERGSALPWLRRYAADAAALPLSEFSELAKTVDYDPIVLAQELGAPLAQVMRRLCTLPMAGGHPEFGLAICDSGGAVLFRKPLLGQIIARDGTACPLWPLFTALSQPGRPVRACLQSGGAPTLQGVAISETRLAGGTQGQVLVEATMMLRAEPAGPAALPQRIGPGCRLCNEDNCPARRQPAFEGL